MPSHHKKRRLLVAYDDSESDLSNSSEASDVDDNIPVNGKGAGRDTGTMRQKRLTLPGAVLEMFKEGKPDSGCKEEHQGRTRSFAHFEGDWATFAFIPVKNGSAEYPSALWKISNKLSSKLPGLQTFSHQELHISISRTVPVRHYWIEPMVNKLRPAIRAIQSFTCCLDLFEVYTNDEKTRTFFGIRILLGEDKIKKLVAAVDSVFEEFGLQKYYEEPRFHLSFAWHLMDVSHQLDDEFISTLQDLLNEISGEEEKKWRNVKVQEICFKTGNKTFRLALG